MRKILVIEDEKPLREGILEVLELEHFEVVGAPNGRVGLEMAREHKPDLIVCDVMMPELDGYGVLENLRKDPATWSIPFIFLTALADRINQRRGMGVGADDYITKPFESDELLAAVRARLARHDLLLRDMNTQLEQLDLIRQVDQELSSRLSPDWVVTLAMDWALRRTNAHTALMGVLKTEDDAKTIEVRYVLSEDTGAPKVGDRIGLRVYLRSIIDEARPVDISDYDATDYKPFAPDMKSMLGVPLLTEDGVLGIILLASRKVDAFSADDVAFLVQMANRAAIAWQHADLFQRLILQQDRELKLRETFGRFVSQEIAQAIDDEHVSLVGEVRTVTVLFCDIRSFTTFTENHAPEMVVALLNEYLSIVVGAADRYGGVVNKFGGDSVLIIYGAPVQMDDSTYKALLTALQIRDDLAAYNDERAAADRLPVRVGIGIDTGQVIAGAVGPESRQEYTVIGDAVNLASRIEALNKRFPEHNILISEHAYEALGKARGLFKYVDLGPIEIRGKAKPVRVYGVDRRAKGDAAAKAEGAAKADAFSKTEEIAKADTESKAAEPPESDSSATKELPQADSAAKTQESPKTGATSKPDSSAEA
jgi:class 3 adenylate cyclase/CheY-like chemotaxis protein